ncbi:MAG: tRNA guanosine-2'-O-methyltransferase [Monoraphidium minutum]|nr:MAG: tRNA guanosine-2'-O-methyltransferase [Monoraphidium minutum]
MGRTRRIRFNRVGGTNWADSESGSGSDAGSDAGAPPAGAPSAGAAGRPRGGGGGGGGPVRYLCYFAQSLLDFRLAEVETLAAMAGAAHGAVTWEAPRNGDLSSPFWYATFPSRSVARHVAERAVLLRALIEVWGEGADWAALQSAVEAYPAARRSRHLGGGSSFRVKIDTWNFKWRDERKAGVLAALDFVGFQGRVDLSDSADASFWVILAAPPPPGEGWDAYIIFGREVAIAASRALPTLFSLKSRRYLGPTSMDAEMAFVMANMAWVRPGQVVLDPFCGTGSILLAAAKRGAHVVGGDIDMRVLRLGKANQKTGEAADNFSNFRQYGLTWPAGLLRMDASRPPFRPGLTEVFDAIVADPPYGVRAGGRKSAPKEGAVVYDPATHFVSTAPYGLSECVDDLVALGARLLRPGGRLVFFIPVSPDTWDPSDLPDHPAMDLAGSCLQPLSQRYGRRLLTYAKVGVFDAAADAAWRAARSGFVMGIERVADAVWEPAEHRTKAQKRAARQREREAAAAAAGGGGGGGGEAGAGSARERAARRDRGLVGAGV